MINEAYPAEWDMKYFSSLKTKKERFDYANKHLKKIGCGSSRCAFFVDDQKVLKIAKQGGNWNKGIAQNETEVDISNYSPIVAQVMDYDESYRWIEAEKAVPFKNNKASREKFRQMTGFDFSYIENLNFYNWNLPDSDVEDSFSANLHDLIGTYGLHTHGDISMDYKIINHYGTVIRNGSEELVLIDYGLTPSIYKEFYLKK